MTNKIQVKIAYIGGGSRAWARNIMADLALCETLGGQITLYDIDREAAECNAVIGGALNARENAKTRWAYKTAQTLKDALTGADFVIISILPGTFNEMRADVHLPERLNIFQSVGDTAGPGGIIRALRAVPMYREFALAIGDFCPKAWVINYTNPMALCVRALYRFFPQIKAFGCCHEVFGAQELLAAMLKTEHGQTNAARDDIIINVTGLNHFTWFTRATYKNIDLFPLYKDFTQKYAKNGFICGADALPDVCFCSSNLVKFDLFNRYGYIAAAGDRHLAEFMPAKLYLNDPETVEKWGFHLTSTEWRERDMQEKIKKTRAYLAGEPFELAPSGEEGVLLIEALCGQKRVVSNVNLPNRMLQITDFPPETTVETNALFSYDCICPVCAGAIPKSIAPLSEPHVKNQTDILNAAINCDRNLVHAAFLRDPLIKDRADEKDILLLANDMIAATQEYLPEEWVK